MSLAIDPDFADNRRFYTCQGGFRVGGGRDVRVVTWRFVDAAATRARMVRVLLDGLPTSSGRHGGCRLLIARNGSLRGRHRRRRGRHQPAESPLASAARRCGSTGPPASPGRPTRSSRARASAATCSPTGTATSRDSPSARDGSLWSVEHGTYRDDEVNKLVAGGNYGWNPVPGYNESVPMTDFEPARQAVRRPVVVRRPDPGDVRGELRARQAVGRAAGHARGGLPEGEPGAVHEVRRASGKLKSVRAPQALRGYGRLRSVTNGPDGTLLITTDNGGGNDVVLKVRPR